MASSFNVSIQRIRRSISSFPVAMMRSFATKSTNTKLDPIVSKYLSEQLPTFGGNNPHEQRKLQAKLIQSLQPVYGKDIKISHLQSFGTVGLKALANSIINEEENSRNSSNDDFVTIRFQIPHHRTEFDLPWYYENSTSLLDIISQSIEGNELLSEYLEGTCGGNASCCSCHVYIINELDDQSPTTKNNEYLSEKDEAEKDMLDLAYERTKQSRLACQVRLIKDIPSQYKNNDGKNNPFLIVQIPKGVNNVWN